MLASFISWWLARIGELLPSAWTNESVRVKDGIVVGIDTHHTISASLRRDGQLEAMSLGAAARMAGRKRILLHPPAAAVLVKHHTVPTAPRRQLDQLLRYELARITPFPAEALFWHWSGRPKPGDGSRTEVILTMVPKMVLEPAMAALNDVGLKADFVEAGPAERPLLIPLDEAGNRSRGATVIRGLAWACGSLAIITLLLPIALQALALHSTNAAIARLKPAINEVEALRQGIAAGDAGRNIMEQESKRTGNLLQILATVTRILPDDTYLTDFSLQDRQMTLSGRSASAPKLITGLSADPAIRNTAFAAPVTRIAGAATDVFSIKAEAAR